MLPRKITLYTKLPYKRITPGSTFIVDEMERLGFDEEERSLHTTFTDMGLWESELLLPN
jgi:hypothetical protein